MAKRQYTDEEMRVILDVETRLPGGRRSQPVGSVAPYKQAPPQATVKPPAFDQKRKPKIDVQHIINWIASVDKLDDVPSVLGVWGDLNAHLQAIGHKPNRFALTALPKVDGSPSWNGDTFSKWLAATTKEDADDLDRVFSALRLRIRAANWYAKRKR